MRWEISPESPYQQLFALQCATEQLRPRPRPRATGMIRRWIGFRLDLISAAVMMAASLIAAAARNSVSPALLGLALSNLLQMTGLMQWFVRQTAEVRVTCRWARG